MPESEPKTVIEKARSPSSIACTALHSKKIESIMKVYNEDKANCSCTTWKFMRRDFKSEEFHSIDLSKLVKSSSSNNINQKSNESKTFFKLPYTEQNQIENFNTKDCETSQSKFNNWYGEKPLNKIIREGKKFNRIWTKINNNYAAYKKSRPCYYQVNFLIL